MELYCLKTKTKNGGCECTLNCVLVRAYKNRPRYHRTWCSFDAHKKQLPIKADSRLFICSSYNIACVQTMYMVSFFQFKACRHIIERFWRWREILTTRAAGMTNDLRRRSAHENPCVILINVQKQQGGNRANNIIVGSYEENQHTASGRLWNIWRTWPTTNYSFYLRSRVVGWYDGCLFSTVIRNVFSRRSRKRAV